MRHPNLFQWGRRPQNDGGVAYIGNDIGEIKRR
jgi:hypothetical protein